MENDGKVTAVDQVVRTLEDAAEKPTLVMSTDEWERALAQAKQEARERGRAEGREDNHKALLRVVFNALCEAIDSSTPIGMPSGYTVAAMVETAVGRDEVAACETLTSVVDPEVLARWLDPEPSLDRIERALDRVLSRYDDGINRTLDKIEREADSLESDAGEIRSAVENAESAISEASEYLDTVMGQAEETRMAVDEIRNAVPDFGDLRSEIVEAIRRDLNLN